MKSTRKETTSKSFDQWVQDVQNGKFKGRKVRTSAVVLPPRHNAQRRSPEKTGGFF